MTRIAYISHPVGGFVEENIQRILTICRDIHLNEKGVIPFAPYLVALKYLKDNVESERALGIEANVEYFKRHIMDEFRLYGPKISEGMEGEIKLCLENNIPIVCSNPILKPSLDLILKLAKTE